MSVTASLISLMCVRTALTAGIPGFKDFAGSNQAAELTNKLLVHAAGTLVTLKLPKDSPLEKASRACLSAAALLARQAMRWEMGDRTPYLQLFLKGWREGTLSTMPLAEARKLPGEPWLRAYTKLVGDPEHWKDFGVQWTTPPLAGGPAADSPLSLFETRADPQTADDLDRALLHWTAENLKEHGPPPGCWESGLRDGFLTQQDGDKRVRFYQAWCVLLRNKLRTTPGLATDFFGRTLLYITQQLPPSGAPPAPSTSPLSPSAVSGFPPLTPDQQQEFIDRCSWLLEERLANDAGPFMQKAEEILQQLDRIEQAIQTADQGSQQRDGKTHQQMTWLQRHLRLLCVSAGLCILLGIAVLRQEAQNAKSIQESRALVQELYARETAPSKGGLENSVAGRRTQVLREMAEERGKTVEWMKQQIDLFILNVRSDPSADSLTRALAEFAAQRYSEASRLARQSGSELRRLRQEREAHLAEQSALIQQEKDGERKALTLAADAEYALGHWRAAEPLYREALALTDEKTDWHIRSTQAWKLSIILLALRMDSEAESLIRKLLSLHSTLEGAESPNAVALTNNLGTLLCDRGDRAEANLLYRRVLETRERLLGPEHPYTLGSLNNLANLLLAQGNFADAEPQFLRVLKTRERVLGPDHPDTLSSLNNLANLLHSHGDRAGATSLCRRTLEARQRVLGPDHPDTLRSLNNLANLLSDQGDWSKAEPLYRRALESMERVLGPDHPDTLRSLNNLANQLLAQSDMAGAAPLYRRAFESMERVLGPDHPDTLSSLNNLANLLRDQGDRTGAGPLYRRVLESMERILGPDHPDTLGSLNNLAVLLCDQGEWEKAEPLYRRALETREWVLGPDHPDTLVSTSNLASLLRNRGLLEEAEPLYRRTLETREWVLGPEHPDTLLSCHHLAVLLFDKKEYPAALELMERAAKGRAVQLGSMHPDTTKSVRAVEIIKRSMGK